MRSSKKSAKEREANEALEQRMAMVKPDLHETNFFTQSEFFACKFTANSKFNFHLQNFFCGFATNNAKENGACSKIVVIKKSEHKSKERGTWFE